MRDYIVRSYTPLGYEDEPVKGICEAYQLFRERTKNWKHVAIIDVEYGEFIEDSLDIMEGV